jgi:predicted LPLAT superfamily acyltransferase
MDADREWQSPCQANSNAPQRTATNVPVGAEAGHPAGAARHPASTLRNAASVIQAVTRPADVRLLLAAASALGHLPALKRAEHLAAGLRELAARLEAGQR